MPPPADPAEPVDEARYAYELVRERCDEHAWRFFEESGLRILRILDSGQFGLVRQAPCPSSRSPLTRAQQVALCEDDKGKHAVKVQSFRSLREKYRGPHKKAYIKRLRELAKSEALCLLRLAGSNNIVRLEHSKVRVARRAARRGWRRLTRRPAQQNPDTAILVMNWVRGMPLQRKLDELNTRGKAMNRRMAACVFVSLSACAARVPPPRSRALTPAPQSTPCWTCVSSRSCTETSSRPT